MFNELCYRLLSNIPREFTPIKSQRPECILVTKVGTNNLQNANSALSFF